MNPYSAILQHFLEVERKEVNEELYPTCQFKPLPEKNRMDIMWRVAVTSAIEGQGETHEIFARLLHNYLTDKPRLVALSDPEAE